MPEQPNNQNPEKPKYGFFYFWLRRIFRFFYHIIRNFNNDDCYEKASALSFYSLLSIVPVLAVLFGIAKGFGFGEALEQEISTGFIQQPEVSQRLIEFANSWLQSVKGNVIAGVGTIVLLWTVISLLNNVEKTLNSIWKVNSGRTFERKIRDYITIFFIAPIFLVASSSLNIYLTTQITQHAHLNIFVETFSPLLLFILKLFPYFLIWVLFTFTYYFIPNTKVNLRDAIIAGVIAGTVFQFVQWVYIQFQIGVSSYGAIYGSFAALPLFLIWLQVSWLIVLAGAELTVEIGNDIIITDFEQEPLSLKTAALLIVYICVEAFDKGNPALTAHELTKRLGISLIQLNRILEPLIKNRIISETSYNDTNYSYQPARAIKDITIQMVCDAIDNNSKILACVQDVKELGKIEDFLAEMHKAANSSAGNKSIYSLFEVLPRSS